MDKSTKLSPEVRERAVRMVQEHRGEYPSLWTAVESIAPKIGCVPATLLGWVQRHEVDTGVRAGTKPPSFGNAVSYGWQGQIRLMTGSGGIIQYYPA